MQVNAISSTPFMAKTAKGNEYLETKLGKSIGTDVGLGVACYGLYKVNKSGIIKIMKPILEQNGFSKGKISSMIALSSAVVIAGYATIGRLLGTVPDVFVNHSNAKKADSALHNEVFSKYAIAQTSSTMVTK